MSLLDVVLESATGSIRCKVEIGQLVIAGWTGRDSVAVEAHIKELEELGVKRPASTPIFYRVAAARLTTGAAIEATGGDSSGEAEYIMLAHEGRLWIGVGSDHTDRVVETYGVTVSKQMCDKPVAATFWPIEEVVDHWDELVLRSYAGEADNAVVYQEGSVAAMLAPEDLIFRYTGGGPLPDGTMMFCGTLPVQGDIRPAATFHVELVDPRLGRSIRHAYSIETLPVLG